MASADKSLKTIVRGSILVIIGLFITKLFGYFFRLVVSRAGPTEYGLFSLGLAVCGFVVTLALVGMNYGVVRYVAYYNSKNNEAKLKGTIVSALKITLPLALVLASLLFIFSDLISVRIFNSPELSIILKIFSFAIPLDVLKRIILMVVKGFKKLKYEVYIKDIVEGSAKVVFAIILIGLGYKALGASISYIIALSLAVLAALFFLEKKVFPLFTSKIKAMTVSRELFSFSIPMMFSDVLYMISFWTDTFMLGIFTAAAVVGLYNAAVPTAQLMLIVPTALAALFMPVITELYAKGEKKNFRESFVMTNKWIYAINLLPLSMFLLFPKEILIILFPDEYAVGYLVLSILAMGYFISALSTPSKVILAMLKKTKLVFAIVFIGGLLNIILNVLLIPKYEMVGAALATSISLLIASSLLMVYAYKVSRVNPFSMIYTKVLLSIVVPSVLFFFLNQKFHFVNNIFSLVFAFLGVVVIYAIMLLLTKSLQRDDKMIINSIKGKLMPKLRGAS